MNTIQLSKNISLKVITLDDAYMLKELMHRIYPPPYKHLWEDNGYWYVEETFSKTALKKELTELNASYYFVVCETVIVGVLRIIYDFSLSDKPALKATKLHRIYLDTKIQGLQFYKNLGYKISNDFRLDFELMHKHLRGMHTMYLTL